MLEANKLVRNMRNTSGQWVNIHTHHMTNGINSGSFSEVMPVTSVDVMVPRLEDG